MENYHKKADELLAAIAERSARIAEINAEYGEKMAGVKALHETAIAADVMALGAARTALVKLMKKNKNEFFNDEVDRVDLPHGSLLYKCRDLVKRVRAVTVEVLEALGYNNAVKTVKLVDWDVVEAWPDVKLAEIGTERKPSEKFEWEIKEGAGDQGPGVGE